MTTHRLRDVAMVLTSNVDKIINPDEHPVRLCNYVDVYKNNFIYDNLPFKIGSATSSEIKKFGVKIDDVIITKDSETADDIGVPALVKSTADDLVCGYHLSILRSDRRRIIGPFLYWHLLSKKTQEDLGNAANGVTRFGLTLGGIKGIPINLPDLTTQREIADFLDRETARIDLLIEKKQKLVKLLGEKSNATITHLTTKGLLGTETVPSGNRWIGEIPGHWKIVRLKHLLANDGAAIKPGPFGSDLRSSDMEGDYATVINQRAVLDGNFSRKGVAVSKEKYEALRSFSVNAGDILLTSRGTIGRATITPENVERAIIHPCVIRVRLHKAKISPQYFLHLLKESAFLEQVLDLSNATTIEVIYGNVLGEVAFSIPPIIEQDRIRIEIEKVSKRAKASQNMINTSIDRLKEYRSALITAAVTGQIDVTTYTKSGATDRRLDAIQEEMGA